MLLLQLLLLLLKLSYFLFLLFLLHFRTSVIWNILDEIIIIQFQGGFEPVDIAVQQGHREVTAMLLEKGAKQGMRALHMAAKKDDKAALKLLIDGKRSVNEKAPVSRLGVVAIFLVVLLCKSSASITAPFMFHW